MRTSARTSFFLVAILFLTDAVGGEPGQKVPPQLILQRFTVAKEGDGLLLPVRVKNKDRMFLLDTGSSHTIFDTTLLDSEPRRKVKIGTPSGLMNTALYDPPNASVGEMPLKLESHILSTDFTEFRRMPGLPIQGVLRMDWLGSHIIHINFDQGELLFLKSAPWDPSEAIPMRWQRGQIPKLSAHVQGLGPTWFIIDSGHLGHTSGLFAKNTIQPLIEDRRIQEIGNTGFTTINNKDETKLYK